MFLIFEDIGCEIRIKTIDGFYFGEIRDGKLMHIRSGATANNLLQIVNYLREIEIERNIG